MKNPDWHITALVPALAVAWWDMERVMEDTALEQAASEMAVRVSVTDPLVISAALGV